MSTATNVTGEAKRKPKLAAGAADKPMNALRPRATKSMNGRFTSFLGMARYLLLDGTAAVRLEAWTAKEASAEDRAKTAELLEHVHAAVALADELRISTLPTDQKEAKQ